MSVEHAVASAVTSVVEVDLHNAYNATEYAGLERCWRGLPGVNSVHLDRTRAIAHLSYDPQETTPDNLREILTRGGYRCDCHRREGSRAQPGHPELGHEHSHRPAHEPGAMEHVGPMPA